MMVALQYLDSLRNTHPELAEWYNSLADLYQKQLWHQLTEKLEQFVALAVFQVDMFHLQSAFASSNWKDAYDVNKKVSAQILFIDPASRAVGLTLNPHLVNDRAPLVHVKVGDKYDQSKVVRIDRRFGLLLEIPSTPSPTPAYVNAEKVVASSLAFLTDSKSSTGRRNPSTNFLQCPLLNISYCPASEAISSHGKSVGRTFIQIYFTF